MSLWHEFLLTQDASVNDGNVSFSHKPASDATILTDLSHYGLLSLEGEDAVTFLQGQVTNDVKKLDGTQGHYSGYCTPKGRLLALFLAFARQDTVYLQFDRALLEAVSKRLRMYVLRSKVVIKDISDATVRLGIAGNQASSALQALFGNVPQTEYATSTFEDVMIIRLPGALARYEIIIPAEKAAGIWSALSQHATPANKTDWDLREIHAGIPEIVPATQEAFVPQMINLDALNGINFKKGCYTGQEIVARTHYLGKVKRRTQLAHIATDSRPNAGDEVQDATGAVTGQIVRSAPNPGGGYDVLAEIRLESLENGPVSWQGNVMGLLSLPYSLEK
ncbi:folate-binding protein YgfZ [Methylobacillus caricis]|uniref:CAF17-like 4Fe-4S cluster assembly/insertion protein YgfZ n=1 Tax=Methylobacillus caricis TaxID=1971611 RepID=UPI001CFFC2CB|nr:folate-binding protein YgfZ [Methylobacillus caricis]MCB5187922.1 folate-binding protein YgfZ [Methylobacillus caricis]